MSEFAAFLELGVRHILDPRGLDHVLFLLVLAAIYRPRDWPDGLRVVTAFTIGHSITLALAVTGVLALPTALVEFLIPVTIVATGLENLIVRERAATLRRVRYRPVLAGIFGLVHGAGFANYLRSLFVEDVAVPLFGFNVGIELAQIFVLVAAGVAFAAVDRGIAAARDQGLAGALRLRTVAVSAVVTLVAAHWAVERSPW